MDSRYSLLINENSYPHRKYEVLRDSDRTLSGSYETNTLDLSNIQTFRTDLTEGTDPTEMDFSEIGTETDTETDLTDLTDPADLLNDRQAKRPLLKKFPRGRNDIPRVWFKKDSEGRPAGARRERWNQIRTIHYWDKNSIPTDRTKSYYIVKMRCFYFSTHDSRIMKRRTMDVNNAMHDQLVSFFEAKLAKMGWRWFFKDILGMNDAAARNVAN